jgi:hypothetical protein
MRTVKGSLVCAYSLRYFDEMRRPQHLQPWMLVSAAWIVPAAFAAINRIAQTHLSGWNPATTRDLLWESGNWFLYAFLTPFVFELSQRWPLVRPHLARRAVLHFGLSLLFCVALATCGKVLQAALTMLFDTSKQQTQFYRQIPLCQYPLRHFPRIV